jgi:MoxR-like ATPase
MYKLIKKGKYMMNNVNIKKFVESLHKSYSNDENKFNWKQIVKVFKTTKFDNKSEVYNWVKAQKSGRGSYIIPLSSVSSSVTNNVVKIDNVKSESSNLDVKSLIPIRDSNYVPFGNYKDLETIITSRQFYPTFVTGPTGNGKSTSIEQICAKHKISLIRVNLNSLTDEDQLIGTKTLVDGNIQIVEGPVVIAMRLGIPLLLDEIDAGGANTLLCLQPILEGKPFYFKLKNEIIVPKNGFNIFATANTKGKGSEDGRYIGTNVLNEAFLERFAVTFQQEYPTPSIELKIVKNLMDSYKCKNDKFAQTLVKWADVIRKTNESGGVDETITTRRLVHIVRAYSVFKDIDKSIQLCTNRFDEATRLAFIDLFDKVSNNKETSAPKPSESEVASAVLNQPQTVSA